MSHKLTLLITLLLLALATPQLHAKTYRVGQTVNYEYLGEPCTAKITAVRHNGRVYEIEILDGQHAGRTTTAPATWLDNHNDPRKIKEQQQREAERQERRDAMKQQQKDRKDQKAAAAMSFQALPTANTRGAEDILVDPFATDWNLPALAEPDRPVAVARPGRVLLRSTVPYPLGRVTFKAAANAPRVAALISVSGIHDDSAAQLEVLSFDQRQSLGSTAFPTAETLLDLSPDGTFALLQESEHKPEGLKLALLLIDITQPSQAKTLKRFRLVKTSSLGSQQATAWLLPDRHLLTYDDNEQRLALLTLPDLQAVYTLQLPRGTTPSLSPDRRLLSFTLDDGFYLLDALTGQTLARAPLAGPRSNAAAISTDRKTIAFLHRGIVTLLDATTGQTRQRFAVAEPLRTLAWLDDRFALTDTGLILDAQLGLFVARTTRNDDNAPTLSPDQLLHGGIIQTRRHPQRNDRLFAFFNPLDPAPLQQAADAVNPQDAWALKPGSPVTLKLQISDPSVRQEARAALEKAIADAGLVLADRADTQLVAKVTAENQTQQLENFRTREIKTVTTTTQVYSLALTHTGQTLWESLSTSGGRIFGTLRVEDDADLQRQVAERGQANARFFTNATLPSQAIKPSFIESLPTYEPPAP